MWTRTRIMSSVEGAMTMRSMPSTMAACTTVTKMSQPAVEFEIKTSRGRGTHRRRTRRQRYVLYTTISHCAVEGRSRGTGGGGSWPEEFRSYSDDPFAYSDNPGPYSESNYSDSGHYRDDESDRESDYGTHDHRPPSFDADATKKALTTGF